jgi:hypothetical protein
MKQLARNVTMVGDGFLNRCPNLLRDRETKFSAAFCAILRSAGVEPWALPPRSQNLNARLERWNRSVKEECLSKRILFGEASLRHALSNYARHDHEERNHQAKDNVILFPAAADRLGTSSGKIRTRAPRRPAQILSPGGRLSFLTLRGPQKRPGEIPPAVVRFF